MRLTHHYACSPVCSPSRAGLLTGRYPQRTGVTGVLREEHNGTGQRLEEETLASMLAAAGYETALVGKWHLGVGEDYQPRKRGFQHFYGFLNGTIDYETHFSGGGGLQGQRTTYRNETPVEEQGYFPELMCRGKPARRLDGVNLLGSLVGTGEPRPRTLLWAFEDTLVGTPP